MLRFIFFLLLCSQMHAFSGKEQESVVLELAQAENRAVVAAFLNPIEDCPWSKKITDEVLTDVRFLEKMGCTALVWRIENGNEEMCARYRLKEFPTLLILDPQGMEFARLGILPLADDAYGEEIYRRIEAFQDVCSLVGKEHFEESQWQQLYAKAKLLSAECYAQVILERGVKCEKGVYFHLEKYALLLQKCKVDHPQVKRLKETIFKRDKRNIYGTRFCVAVMDFESRVQRHVSKTHIKKNLRPLIHYLRTWGKKDSSYEWQAQKIAGEYLWSKGILTQAFDFALKAQEKAPEGVQGELAEWIALMQRQMHR